MKITSTIAPDVSPACREMQGDSLKHAECPLPANPARIQPAIDSTELITRCHGNMTFVLALLDEFVASCCDQVSTVETMIANLDFKQIFEYGHSLRGVAGILAAERLRGLASDLQTAARAEDLPEVLEIAQWLQAETRRCVDEIPNIRGICEAKLNALKVI